MQAELAKSQVGIDIKTNNAKTREAEGRGEAAYVKQTGKAQGAQVEAVRMARAKAFKSQVEALGQTQTAVVNVVTALAEKNMKIVPEVLVAGGENSVEGLAATLMKYYSPDKTTPVQETSKPLKK